MAHNCVDWTARPPTRKMPFLILTRGDDHVYAIVPKELKTLEEIARREFDLGDVEIHFSSSCLSLCNGLSARITESAWELMSPYIGCATVEDSGPRIVRPRGILREEEPTASENTQDERDLSAKQKLPSENGEGDENEQPDRGPGGKPNTLAREAVRDEQNALSDHGNDHDGASAAEDQHEEPWEEEVSEDPLQKPRNRRRVVSEDEGEGEESEREHEVPLRSQKPTQPSKEVEKERDGGYRSQVDLQPAEPLHQPSKPIKQEKRESGSGSQSYSHDGHSQSPYTETRHGTQTQAQVESNGCHKLMIRVAHRPSKQESKFTTKSTTRVAKVLVAVCKSFGLDAGRATLYLIVSMEDEDGEMESLFPCDKNDTIARAGAELNTESRFLLKIAGEA